MCLYVEPDIWMAFTVSESVIHRASDIYRHGSEMDLSQAQSCVRGTRTSLSSFSLLLVLFV